MPPKGSFSNLRNIIKEFLGIPLTFISLFFIGYFIVKSFDSVFETIISANYPLISIGIFSLTVFFFFRALTYHLILLSMGEKIPTKDSLYLLSLSELRRYIPGNITAFISRIHYFRSDNFASGKIVKSLVFESVIFVASAIPFSILGIILAKNYLQIPLSFIFYAGLLTMPVVLFIILFRKRVDAGLRSFFQLRYAFLAASIGWVFFGLGNYLIAASIINLNPQNILHLSSFFIFSWLVGYLSFITPMGLGVREGFVTIILSKTTSVPVAAALSISLRVFLIAAEFIFVASSYIFKKYLYKKLSHIPWQDAGVCALFITYAFYFSFYTTAKHANFFTGKFDLGNMTHTMWNTLHGRIFQFTDPSGSETLSRLSDHADFILVILSPLLLIWNDPRILLIFQSSVIAAGSIFIYLLSEKILKSKNIALVFSFSYLMNFWVQWQNLFDFHAVSLSTTFLLGFIYFLSIKKLKWGLFFLGLSTLTKENVYLVISMLGIFEFFVMKKRKLGIALFVIPILIFYVFVSILIPGARGSEHLAFNYYDELGSSTGGIVMSILTNPISAIKTVIEHNVIDYMFRLLLPTGFLGLVSPLFLIFALPDFAINTLSENANLRAIWYHYASIITPFTYISALYGLKKLHRIRKKLFSYELFGAYIIFFTLFSAWKFGPLPGAKNPHVEVYTNKLQQRNEISLFLQTIPPELSVAATNNVGAHLTNREHIYVIPNGVEKADIIVFLLNDPKTASPSLDAQIAMASAMKGDNNFRILFEQGDFIAFKRIN